MSFNIANRRYTGSKAKLADWIMELIAQNCKGDSFCDIFAGTGIISERAIKSYKKVLINDLLFSNNIIYSAFFKQTEYSKEKIEVFKNKYNKLNPRELSANYVSENFRHLFLQVTSKLKD